MIGKCDAGAYMRISKSIFKIGTSNAVGLQEKMQGKIIFK
jgi:hypothetical protein